MTTATDWEPGTWTDTGEFAVVTDVTSAPTDTPFLPEVPPAVAFYREPTREQIEAEPTPQIPGGIPSADDVREKNRLTQAKMRQLEMLDDQIAYWHSVTSRAWAKRSEAVSIISEQYTAKREALLTSYERECEAIKAGLRGREYGGHVYDEDAGFVTVQADVPPHDRIERMKNEPERYFREARERAMPDRSDVERMTQRSREQLRRRERDTSEAEPAETPRSPWWRRHADVIAGVAIGAGLFAALTVTYMTGVL